MLFMTVENNKDVYSDLLIVQDWRDRALVFLQEKENLTRLIIAKIKRNSIAWYARYIYDFFFF